MRLLISSLFYRDPFGNLQKHADYVKACAQLLRDAASAHLLGEDDKFEELTDQVARLESEADAIKRNIRNHLPKGILMPVDKFQFFDYLREQDHVLDEVEEALFWLSFRPGGIPEDLAEDLQHLISMVIPVIEDMPTLVSLARSFFKSGSGKERANIKSLIHDIRQKEKEADLLERELKQTIFSKVKDPLGVFYLIGLVDIIGNIADHAQNASDRMRAMIAK